MNEPNPMSEAVQDYLKAIYQIGYSGNGAPVQEIAAQVGVSPAGVSKMLRHLQKLRVVRYTPYHPVFLTESGEKIALEVIRHHRLIELYLMQGLGYTWEQVHAEADKLEHHISEEFEDTIDRLLGFPAFDPHGDPIPSRDGTPPPVVTSALDGQENGSEVIVRRVTDEDPQMLRYFAEHGIVPGVVLVLVDREPFGGSLRLLLERGEVRITPFAAKHIFVESTSSSPELELASSDNGLRRREGTAE